MQLDATDENCSCFEFVFTNCKMPHLANKFIEATTDF